MRRLLAASILLLCTAALAQGEPTPADLTAVFTETVKRKVEVPSDVAYNYLVEANKRLEAAGHDLDREQFLLVVDRNPHVQTMLVFLGGGPKNSFVLVGASPVSTGGTTRFDHYVTPEGVYDHQFTTEYSDFRAEGSKNENGIRGYGAKGMRIWDFGWFRAEKTWLKNRTEEGDIRFQMHATDADVLEAKLGSVASKGCIRLSGPLNAFLDKYGALDWHYEQAAASGRKAWVLRKDRVQTPYSGRYLVVLDSQVTEKPSWRQAAPGTQQRTNASKEQP